MQKILEKVPEMKIALTGYSSELGEAVFKHLAREGHDIVLLGRKSQDVYFDYAKQVCGISEKVDALIFLAHDYSLNYRSVEQAAEWLESVLLKIAAPKALYISSRSVHPSNPSTYAYHKKALENIFNKLNYEVLRLGLINQTNSSQTQTRPVRLLTKILDPLPITFQLNEKTQFFSCDIDEVAFWINKWAGGIEYKDVHTLGGQSEMDFAELCSKLGIPQRRIKVTLPVGTIKWILKLAKSSSKNFDNGGLDKLINGFSGMN